LREPRACRAFRDWLRQDSYSFVTLSSMGRAGLRESPFSTAEEARAGRGETPACPHHAWQLRLCDSCSDKLILAVEASELPIQVGSIGCHVEVSVP